MRLKVGAKVVYPNQGPCLIGAIVQKVIDGQPVNFYKLVLLNETGGELFIPVDRVDTNGIRQLLNKSEIPQLLRMLNQSAALKTDWKQRFNDNSKHLASGLPIDLAKVVESLTNLSSTKELSFIEGQMLYKARKLLVSEIAEVICRPQSTAEELIDRALKGSRIRDA